MIARDQKSTSRAARLGTSSPDNADGDESACAVVVDGLHNVFVKEEPPSGGPLSDAERESFVDLLRRVCEHELDQWEHWRYRTSYGNVYIDISRRLPEGHPEAAYDEIPQPAQ